MFLLLFQLGIVCLQDFLLLLQLLHFDFEFIVDLLQFVKATLEVRNFPLAFVGPVVVDLVKLC